MKIYCILFWLCCLCSNLTTAFGQNDTTALRIKLIDKQSQPIFGVYVVDKKNNHLLTTSDIDGECLLHPQLLHRNDSLLFQGMGYKVISKTLADLQKNSTIELEELNYELSEVTVRNVPTARLLKDAEMQIIKLPRNSPAICNFTGKSQYEKITEYRNKVLEYRREFGTYFTTGDLRPKNIWDQNFRSYFVPAYVARSYNLTNDGSDTLAPVYMTTEDTRFDAGTRKVFTLLRTVQLYGPLFAGTADYDIRRMESDSTDYLFSFKTKTSSYPDKIRISCKGTFVLDFTTHRLKKITFDYIDYQLYRQVIMTNQRKISSPFSTQAEVTFDYDKEGQIFIRSCSQETRWKYDLGDNFILIEQPSRMHPAAGNLVEKEAFHCYDYQPVQDQYRTPGTLSKIHVSQRNPVGAYDSLLFTRLSPLLENQKARTDLSEFESLEKQYRYNDKRTYYPDNFLNGFNGFNGLGRDAKSYRNNTHAVRKQLFEIFPAPQYP